MKVLSKIELEKKRLHYIHFYLSSLSYYNKNASSAEESLMEDMDFVELLNEEWGSPFLRKETFGLLRLFRNKWLDYKRNVNYSECIFFYFYDPNWNDIVKDFLVPTLNSLEKDFEINGIDFVEYKGYLVKGDLPSSADVLERGHTLYGLLLKHGIITKNYLD